MFYVVNWQLQDLYSDPEVRLSSGQGCMQDSMRALSHSQLLCSFLLGSYMLPVPLLQLQVQGVVSLFQPLHIRYGHTEQQDHSQSNMQQVSC